MLRRHTWRQWSAFTVVHHVLLLYLQKQQGGLKIVVLHLLNMFISGLKGSDFTTGNMFFFFQGLKQIEAVFGIPFKPELGSPNGAHRGHGLDLDPSNRRKSCWGDPIPLSV